MPTIDKKFLVNIDLSHNELRQGVPEKASNVAQSISNPVLGQIAFDTNDNKFAVCIDPTSTPYPTWAKMGTSSSDGHTYDISPSSGLTVTLTQDGTTNAGSFTVQDGSTSQKGVVQLSNSYSSSSQTLAATTKALVDGLATKAPTSHASTSTTYGIGTGSNYGHVKLSDSTSSTSSASSGIAATPKAVNDALTAAKSYTDGAVSGIVGPMMFKGTLGTGGNITSLPTASASNVGYVYKVITADIYAEQAAKVGDMFIGTKTSDDPAAYAWTYVPSGDEQGIPTGGSDNQYLEYGGSSGTAAWETPITNLSASGATSSTNLITAKAVADAIAASQAGTITPEQISRATFTIASGAPSGYIDLPSGSDVFSVSEVQNTHGVVTDWTFTNNRVTATLASNATADVKVNVLYYSGGTIASTAQADYVVDQGTDNYWTWRLWNSGIAEAWGNFQTTFPAGTNNNRYGSLPSRAANTGVFVGADPTINANVWMEGTSSATIQYTEASIANNQWTVYINAGGSGTKNTWVYLHLIGRWKN